MKNLLKIILFCPLIINSQVLTDLVSQYARFVTTDVKTEVYEATIEYMSGRKTFNTLSNCITSYDVSIPKLGIDYKGKTYYMAKPSDK